MIKLQEKIPKELGSSKDLFQNVFMEMTSRVTKMNNVKKDREKGKQTDEEEGIRRLNK